MLCGPQSCYCQHKASMTQSLHGIFCYTRWLKLWPKKPASTSLFWHDCAKLIIYPVCWLTAERRTTALLLNALCPLGIKSSHKHRNVRWLSIEIMARRMESKTLLLFLLSIGNREGELNKVLKEGQQGFHFEKQQKAPDGSHFHRAASAVCDTQPALVPSCQKHSGKWSTRIINGILECTKQWQLCGLAAHEPHTDVRLASLARPELRPCQIWT